ncbi:MAG TPA: hypothetical protein VGP57_04285 [Actinoplanes sp.]|nr:hypothetical protein [Actinoplanes sp.]
MSTPYPSAPADETEPDETEPDEYQGPPVPEPPRRIPFGITLATALLGVVTVLLLTLAVAAVASFASDQSVGRSAAGGLLMCLLTVCAALSAAVSWSFVRNGNQIGALVVGGLVALTGLISLADGMLNEDSASGVAFGLLGIVLGLLVGLVPLLGDGPGYLAARRVWSKAEREWLRDLTTAAVPMAPAWPGAHPGQQWQGPQPQAWPVPQAWPQPQSWPGPHAQPQPWPGPHPQQHWGMPPQQQWAPPPSQPRPDQVWQTPPAGPQPQSAPPAPAPTGPAQPASAQPAESPAPQSAPPAPETTH